MHTFSWRTILGTTLVVLVLFGMYAPDALAGNVTVNISDLTPKKTVKSSDELTSTGFWGTNLTPCTIVQKNALVLSYDPATEGTIETSDGRIGICPKNIAQSLPGSEKDALGTLQESIIWMMNQIIMVVGNIGIYALGLAAQAMGVFLAFGKFTTHDFVKTGWPFLQGIANLGFILALLFIAGATALQLESYSWRRLLPKLFIAALFINFSLVIGAIVIDASRVLMAVEVKLLTNGKDLTQIGTQIAMNSPLMKGVYDSTSKSFAAQGSHSWDIPIRLLQAVSMVWILAVGMLFVAFMLFARWVVLVVLLIVSPLAYLSLVLPATESLGKRWWKEFLTWSFYGPVLLFFLLLLTKVGYTAIPESNSWATLANNIVLGVLLFAAAKSAKMLSGVGGAAAIGFATSLPGMAYRNPKKTAAIIGGVMTGGIGGAVGYAAVAGAGQLAGQAGKGMAKGAALQVRDFVKPIKKTLYKGARKKMPTLFGPERDDKGNLLKGETSSGDYYGRQLAAATGLYEKGKQVAGWEKGMYDDGKKMNKLKKDGKKKEMIDNVRSDPAYTRMHVDKVGTAMNRTQTRAVIDTALDGNLDTAGADYDRLWNMVRSEYAFNNISEQDRAEITSLNFPKALGEMNKNRAERGELTIVLSEKEREQLFINESKDSVVLDNDLKSRITRLVDDAKKASSGSWKTVRGDDWV